MSREARRRLRWRPSRIDFATWAVCSVWETLAGVMSGLQALRAWAGRPRRRAAAPWWPGTRPA